MKFNQKYLLFSFLLLVWSLQSKCRLTICWMISKHPLCAWEVTAIYVVASVQSRTALIFLFKFLSFIYDNLNVLSHFFCFTALKDIIKFAWKSFLIKLNPEGIGKEKVNFIYILGQANVLHRLIGQVEKLLINRACIHLYFYLT